MKSGTRHRASAFRWVAAGAGLAAGLYATNAGLTWLRYGNPPSPASDEADQLLDQFIPVYEVVERHSVRVAAPAETTLLAACEMNLLGSAIIRGLMKAREMAMGGVAGDAHRPRTLLEQVKELGWGVLGEVPDREIVFGAVTQPWLANPLFRPLPPGEFAAFHEPGYAKIAWTLRADPIDLTASMARTETRVATTDPAARRAFRRYWSFVSPGVVLIRWLSLRLMKTQAEGENALRAARLSSTRSSES